MKGAVIVPLVMVAFATASAATMLRDAVLGFVHRTHYSVRILDADLKRLQSIIPKGETLGYITDGKDIEAVNLRLYGLNYNLSPLIVENAANRRFVIGDFRSKSSIPTAFKQQGMRVVKDLGDGLLLFADQ
jgi:hypothetical protein